MIVSIKNINSKILHVKNAFLPKFSNSLTYKIPKLFMVPNTINWMRNAAAQTIQPQPPSGGETIGNSFLFSRRLFKYCVKPMVFSWLTLANGKLGSSRRHSALGRPHFCWGDDVSAASLVYTRNFIGSHKLNDVINYMRFPLTLVIYLD